MRRFTVLVVAAAINALSIPALASECNSDKDISASRARWAAVRSKVADATNPEGACRAYATSFYESVTARQAAAKCLDDGRTLAALNSEINAFNDLLANKCGS